jgi:N-methylhydantoinase B
VDEREMTIDFSGSASQRFDVAINSSWNFTASYVHLAIKAIVDPDTPQTHGTIQPITIRAPDGSIVNATPPAPVSARHVLQDQIVGSIAGALHEALPDSVPASGGSLYTLAINFAGKDQPQQKVALDLHYSGAGARSDRDGHPAVACVSNAKNIPIENLEVELPLLLHRYQLVQDSSGAGTYRGGSSTVREYEFLQPAQLQFIYNKERHYGLNGGQEGRSGEVLLNPGEEEDVLGTKDGTAVEKHDVLRVYTPGGGGYGDPADRDLAKVRRDIENGLISSEFARQVYGHE